MYNYSYKVVTRYRKDGRWKTFYDVYDGYGNVEEVIDRWTSDNEEYINNNKAYIDCIYRDWNGRWEIVDY